MSDINLELLSDEELITYYKQGNTFAYEILHKRYKTLIASMTRRYFLVGGDQDDLIQEASIALFNAINSFNGKKSFKNFALTCIQNKLKTTIKTSLRKKNLPLYNYLSLSGDSDNDVDKSSIIISNDIGPEDIIINEEEQINLSKAIKDNLSKLEYKIFVLYLYGRSNKFIAEIFSRSEKSIDNAIQRSKKKIAKILNRN